MDLSNPVALAPFSGLARPATSCSGVQIAQRDGFGLATLHVRRAGREMLALHLRERLGIELPKGPLRTTAGGRALIGTGPGTWLATSEGEGNAFATSLREAVGDLASVVDQSDGYAVLRLSGSRARDAMRKLVSVDLHAHVFKVGGAAVTPAGHVGATLWRLEDAPDGSAVFEIAVFRSYAGSFWHELVEGAAEFGIVGGG